jgi:leader peptidase (prepilin peptidase)/N-methyltransferase
MGYGDFKMLAMLGAWLGVQAIPLIIVLSSFAGVAVGGTMIIFGRDKTKPIKFGPFLAVAGFVALLWGDELIDIYFIFSFGA